MRRKKVFIKYGGPKTNWLSYKKHLQLRKIILLQITGIECFQLSAVDHELLFSISSKRKRNHEVSYPNNLKGSIFLKLIIALLTLPFKKTAKFVHLHKINKKLCKNVQIKKAHLTNQCTFIYLS